MPDVTSMCKGVPGLIGEVGRHWQGGQVLILEDSLRHISDWN